MAPDALQLNM